MVNLLALSLIFGDSRLFFNQIILFIVLIIQVVELIRFLNYTNRELSKFILSIVHNDLSVNFKRTRIGGSFAELHDAFDQIIQAYEDAKIEKQAQFEYLRLVVNSINIGIISIENQQSIVLMNKSAERALGVKGIKNWQILAEKTPLFTKEIEQLGDSGRKLIEVSKEGQPLTLSVDVVSMKMLQKSYKLITFQDIRGEIEQKEIEAWHKLIRILTHEIMNSATPISSLTETMQSMLERDGQPIGMDRLNDEAISDLLFSLKTIQRRSDGMLTFIDDYRKLTKVAKPKIGEVVAIDLLASVGQLLAPDLDKQNINLKITCPPHLAIDLDTTLVEQVLINLIKNSSHALENTTSPVIELKAYEEQERKIIEVTDNGIGIKDKELKEIFVPFFSTKKDGSGIGLSLSKQIMHVHGGNIRVRSQEGQGTTFYLIFRS